MNPGGARDGIADLTEAAEFRRTWLEAHPEALPRLERVERQLATLRPPPAVEPAVVGLERRIGRSIRRSVGGPELGL